MSAAHPTFRGYVNELLLGGDDATDFFMEFFEVAHVIDDLVDRDRGVSDEDIIKAFRGALVTIPENKFYRLNYHELQPLFSIALLNWLAATKMERAASAPKEVAFVIRSDYCNILLKCMELVGGFEYANSRWAGVRTWWHQEGLEQYEAALRDEQAARRSEES